MIRRYGELGGKARLIVIGGKRHAVCAEFFLPGAGGGLSSLPCVAEPTAEEIARFDRKRKDKKVSNEEWQSETDPDSRIAKMKDGRTHLAYKAEHAVDLATGLILAATVYPANQADSSTVGPTISEAQDNLIAAESDKHIEEAVLDKGYYKHETLAELEFTEGLRTYVAEPKQNGPGNGKDKPAEERQAIANNRRRIRGDRGRAL